MAAIVYIQRSNRSGMRGDTSKMAERRPLKCILSGEACSDQQIFLADVGDLVTCNLVVVESVSPNDLSSTSLLFILFKGNFRCLFKVSISRVS